MNSIASISPEQKGATLGAPLNSGQETSPNGDSFVFALLAALVNGESASPHCDTDENGIIENGPLKRETKPTHSDGDSMSMTLLPIPMITVGIPTSDQTGQDEVAIGAVDVSSASNELPRVMTTEQNEAAKSFPLTRPFAFALPQISSLPQPPPEPGGIETSFDGDIPGTKVMHDEPTQEWLDKAAEILAEGPRVSQSETGISTNLFPMENKADGDESSAFVESLQPLHERVCQQPLVNNTLAPVTPMACKGIDMANPIVTRPISHTPPIQPPIAVVEFKRAREENQGNNTRQVATGLKSTINLLGLTADQSMHRSIRPPVVQPMPVPTGAESQGANESLSTLEEPLFRMAGKIDVASHRQQDKIQPSVFFVSDYIQLPGATAHSNLHHFVTPVENSPFKQIEKLLTEARQAVITTGKATEIEVVLEPKELGKLAVKVSVEAGVANARFHAESHAVKQLIEAELPRLKDLLNEQGIRLDQAMVQVGGGASEGYHQPQHGRSAPNKRTGLRPKGTGRAEFQDISQAAHTAVTMPVGLGRRFDYMA